MAGQNELLHELSQPVNVIRLTAANMGARLVSRLEGDDKAYLVDRLAVIEAQIERFTAIAEQVDRGRFTGGSEQKL
jgi:signal transduction histidine kinase